MIQLSDKHYITHKLKSCDYLICLCICFSFFTPRFVLLELDTTTAGCSRHGDESLFMFFLCFLLILICRLYSSLFDIFGKALLSMFLLDECFLFLFLLSRLSAAERPASTQKSHQSYSCNHRFLKTKNNLFHK